MSIEEDMFEVEEGPTEGARSRAVGSGSVLVAVASLRRDIAARLTRLQNEITAIGDAERELKDKVSDIGRELTAGIDSLKKLSEVQFVGGETEGTKKNRIPKVPLRHLGFSAGPQRAVEPLLTWTIISTVLSFVHAMPALRFWVSDTLWGKMAPFANVVSSSQGFAAIMFSARHNRKAKLGTRPGQLWLFVLSRSLMSVISSAKRDLFQSGIESTAAPLDGAITDVTVGHGSGTTISDKRPHAPEWLAKFKSDADIFIAVRDAMCKFGGVLMDASVSSATGDSSSEGPKRSKKRRKTGEEVDVDPELLFRQSIVAQIRSKWLEKLNFGRSGVRKFLYAELVCILDRIATLKSVGAARLRGYEIILHGYDSELEDIDKDTPNLDRSIWNIPDAYVDGTALSDTKNMELRRKLEEKFPSLHATICYRQRVHKAMDQSTAFSAEEENVARVENRREKVSLHAVAHGVLMEIYCADSLERVLRVSQLSLKAVHVIAVALRGLIVDVLNKYRERKVELSASEEAALGPDVSLNDKDKVMVLMDKVLSDGKMNKVYSDSYAAKFETTEMEPNVEDPEGPEGPEVQAAEQLPVGHELISLGDWTRRK